MATVQERLTSLINAANTTTGKSDADMTAATQSLIDGFGGGGPCDHTMEDGLVSRDIETYHNDRVTTVGISAFQAWKSVKHIELPNLERITGPNAFSASGIEEAIYPRLESGAGNDFRFCASLKTAVFLGSNTFPSFGSCEALTAVTAGSDSLMIANHLGVIGQRTFDRCSVMTKLVLRSASDSELFTLGNTNAFADTPIEKGTGYIYVPKALVEQYKAATNWITYAAQIRAIEDYPDITGG